MADVGRSTVVRMLAALADGYGDVLGLLDRTAAIQRIVDPLTGADVAWVGDLRTGHRIVLGHPVNTAINVVEGLVVLAGTGLGWRALAVPIINNGNRAGCGFSGRVAACMDLMTSRIAAAEVVAERDRHAAEVAVHEERRRLSMELHDTVGAMLYTLGVRIRRLGTEPGLDDSVRGRLSTIGEYVAEATAAMRGSLRMLTATPEQVALGVALREHCQAFQERTGILARLITLTDLPAMSDARGRMLSDATREALLNVEKHARAGSVVVSVRALHHGVAVTVADDGVGCDPSEVDSGGLGLAAMTGRVARVGGAVTVSRNEDGGLTVRIWVPA